jgi:hypothetical protein
MAPSERGAVWRLTDAGASGMPRLRTFGAVLLVTLAVGSGCVSWSQPFGRERDGTYVHRDRGDRIPAPEPIAGENWERQKLPGADLSFRQPVSDEAGRRGTATLSMLASCREVVQDAQLRARNLRLGLSGARSRYSAPTAHLGYPGWAQAFEAQVEGETVYVEVVTLVADRCTFDLILATPVESPAMVAAFQNWWTGFVPGAHGVPPPIASESESG